MKIIKDIRLYKSDTENTDGNPLPSGFDAKSLNNVIRRVVMKLREQEFVLGDFDHLYLNFTSCVENGTFQVAKRTADKYYPWYRYYDVGVDKETLGKLDTPEYNSTVLKLTKQTLLNCFAKNANDEQKITTAFDEALSKGENMLMRFKVKQGAKNKAVIFLRYLESTEYSPLLCVYDMNETEILRRDLPPTADLSSIGEIQLSSKRVTVKPRKNSFSKDLTAISFDL